MSIQLSVAVRNARLDAIETTIGVSPVFRLYVGALPANCAAAPTGLLLLTDTLAADWAANAAAGSKAFNNLPVVGVAAASGTVGYYRVWENTVTTCHMQGTVTITGGGGDITIDNPVLVLGQAVNITSWTITDANA